MPGAAMISAAAVGMLVLLGGSVALSSGTGGSCGTGAIDIGTLASSAVTIGGMDAEQLVNAALIMNAATAAGLPQRAQILGVMTALGESSLRNIAYGDEIHGVTNPDGTATTSLGLFQQQDSWGAATQRLDPAQSAGLFFSRLATIPNWDTLAPSAAAHQVQANADPDHYTPSFAPATEIVGTLTATAGGGGCTIGGDAQALAQELVAHADNGTLTGSVPDHIKQIRWIAHGQSVSGCGIDTRILQVLVLAVRSFNSVGVSTINRHCTGEIVGAGTASAHYKDGGGHAVDLTRLGTTRLTGADAESVKLVSLLDPLMPAGSHAGQAGCREAAGTELALKNLGQFDDACHHLHLDVGNADGPLNLG